MAVGHTKEFEQILAGGNKIYLYINGEKKKVGVVNIHGPMLPDNTCKTRRIKDQISQA